MKYLLFFLLLCLGATAHAADNDDDKGATSGLPLPRFASLRSNDVNLRTGPGTRYPIEWVFVHQGVPVEITAEYDIWRRIRDWDGTEGWVHKSALSGKRAVIVTGSTRNLRSSDDPQATVLAHLEPNVLGQLISCSKDWCRVKVDGTKGYLRKNEFWGAYPTETLE